MFYWLQCKYQIAFFSLSTSSLELTRMQVYNGLILVMYFCNTYQVLLLNSTRGVHIFQLCTRIIIYYPIGQAVWFFSWDACRSININECHAPNKRCSSSWAPGQPWHLFERGWCQNICLCFEWVVLFTRLIISPCVRYVNSSALLLKHIFYKDKINLLSMLWVDSGR